jgi:hypothetical protein
VNNVVQTIRDLFLCPSIQGGSPLQKSDVAAGLDGHCLDSLRYILDDISMQTHQQILATIGTCYLPQHLLMVAWECNIKSDY